MSQINFYADKDNELPVVVRMQKEEGGPFLPIGVMNPGDDHEQLYTSRPNSLTFEDQPLEILADNNKRYVFVLATVPNVVFEWWQDGVEGLCALSAYKAGEKMAELKFYPSNVSVSINLYIGEDSSHEAIEPVFTEIRGALKNARVGEWIQFNYAIRSLINR